MIGRGSGRQIPGIEDAERTLTRALTRHPQGPAHLWDILGRSMRPRVLFGWETGTSPCGRGADRRKRTRKSSFEREDGLEWVRPAVNMVLHEADIGVGVTFGANVVVFGGHIRGHRGSDPCRTSSVEGKGAVLSAGLPLLRLNLVEREANCDAGRPCCGPNHRQRAPADCEMATSPAFP